MVGTGSATRAGNRTAKSESRRTVWTWRAAWACGALRTRIGCEGVEVGAGVSSAVAVLVIVVGAVVAVTALLLLLPLLLDLPVGDMAVVGGQQCEECVRCCEMYRS